MSKEAVKYQEGKVIDLTLTEDVNVGDVIPLVGMIAVAGISGLTGEIISAETEGVYEIKATDADAIAVGDEVYFDATARTITTTSTDNTRAGRAISSKASATAGMVYVKINAA